MYQFGNKHEYYESQITNGESSGVFNLKAHSLLAKNDHFVLHEFFAKLFGCNVERKNHKIQ